VGKDAVTGTLGAVVTQTYVIDKTATTGHYSFSGTTGSYIKANNIAPIALKFDEIVLDFTPHQSTTANGYYVDGRTGLANGYFYRDYATGNDLKGAGILTVYVDGVDKTSSNVKVAKDQRTTLRLLTNTGTDDVNILGGYNNGTEPLSADIYSAKFYLGGTLVCYYDFTKQSSSTTVYDQSGFGLNGIMNNGTFVAG
jgi:hypothetical protein